MQRIDGHYLYTLGYQLHPLSRLRGDDDAVPMNLGEAFPLIWFADSTLDAFLHNSVFRLRYSLGTGESLLAAIRSVRDETMEAKDFTVSLKSGDVYAIKQCLTVFETNLASEMALLDTYLVAKKGALDTTDLIWRGEAAMSPDLAVKVPEAIPDVQQATKCIAFEVPTAAAFHLHRANEAVLRRYYDEVSNGHARPKTRNIGDYLNALDKLGLGDPRVKASLRDLKDLHRNPLIHPEHSLESVDEAIDLLGAIRAVVGQMLKEITTPAPPALPPA
jgi:hypothetical protein